ncbi:hypothetical protein CK203_079345 [Vitis vinifera]|uniref:Endonuclease/exonuclease/phosphatase domain-containing protein n=1 Tax=Vitis vinifera TaxID=29760 RepID=A0A438DGN7_VITVI|nr:hypothetical protein CK203_079345 [Vitis vinifera]
MEMEVIQPACPYQMSESVNSLSANLRSPCKESSKATVTWEDYPLGKWQKGLGSKKKRRVVKDFLRSEKPDVVMIQETKKEECDRRFGGGSVRFFFGLNQVRIGRLRIFVAICSLWPKQLSSQEGFLGGAFRHCWAAYPRWCVGGDFNVIRRSSEKLGGSRLTPSMKDFDDFIRDCELIDLPLRSASFTWSNMQENPVCKRLDRFLYSNEWEQFPQSIQGVLPRWTSDHWPIVLETNPFKWGPTPFRFENMWLQHPSFKENFGRWWREFQGNGWEGHKFMRKLQFVKAKLKEWNKASFGELSISKSSTSPSGESWRVEGLDWSPISGESAFRLESPFTEEEIFKAIFQMDRDKAPGRMALPLQCFKIVGK